MKNSIVTFLVLAMASSTMCVPFAMAQTAEAPAKAPESKKAAPEDELIFQSLLAALETGDYAAFIARGDDGFKKALTKPIFDLVHAQVGPRFEAGFETTFLGEMKQSGYRVLLWKVSFQDKGDDFLARLALKEAQVSGFLLN